MESTCTSKISALVLLAITFSSHSADHLTGDHVLDLFIGQWDARVTTLQPKQSEVTYTETYEWTLNHKFLRGETKHRSDGAEDVIYGSYDEQADGYPFWIFSSSGSAVYLAPAKWDANTRKMVWKNPANSDIYYTTLLTFPNDNTRRWSVMIKDWKGSVLLQQEGRAVRRNK